MLKYANNISINITMEDYKARIEGFLKDNPRGSSIEEISARNQLNRQATKVILAKLIGEGKVSERVVGRAKLHYWIFKEMRKTDDF